MAWLGSPGYSSKAYAFLDFLFKPWVKPRQSLTEGENVKQTYLILVLFLVLLCGGASAAILKTEYNASDMTVACGGNWANVANVLDEDWGTYSRASSGDAYCILNVSRHSGLKNATWNVRSNGLTTEHIFLPSSCLLGVGYSLRFDSNVGASFPSDGAVWYCLNTTGALQVLYSNGGGNFPPDHAYIYEQSLNVTYDNESYCPAKPSFPMFMADSFDYIDAVDTCGWSSAPITPTYPVSNQLCYDTADNGGTAEFFSFNGQGNYFSSDVWTEEFSITVKNESTYLQHDIEFAPNSGHGIPAATLTFFSDTVSVITGNDLNTTLTSICAGCYAYGVQVSVKLTLYSSQATGYTILNSTSNQVQAIIPGTMAVSINGGNWSFNIPLRADIYENPHLQASVFNVYQRGVCLDNIKVYSGFVATAQQTVNQTGIPYRQLGEFCNTDWECFTGLCSFIHQCVKKGWSVACTNDYECVSYHCNNGKCTKPTLWDSATAVKDENAGDDEPTNNLVSIIFSLLFAMAFGLVIYKLAGDKAGFAAIVSGISFVIFLGLFALGGWLSPWILVMLIICLILLTVVIIVVGAQGG